jgi:uncharacterized protein (TIGR03790 family)
MKRPAMYLVCAGLLFDAGRVWAGGSGLNTVVVVNQNSSNSVQLGNEYCLARQVPPQNLFRMTGWNGGAIDWTRNEFESRLRQPLLGMIAERGLTNQIQFVLLSMDIPYRVTDGTNGQNSTTSALFYGFKPDGVSPFPGYPGCSLPASSANSYASSELPSNAAQPATADTNSFLAMMLTDTSVAGAEFVLNSSVASDSTFPTQAVYLAKTSDTGRNVRFVEFDNAIFDSRIRADSTLLRLVTDSTSFTNLLGLLTGRDNYSLPAAAFVPGAMADTLTSYAGTLFEEYRTGQTPLLAFLEAGAAASYGTVVEPCAYLQKFPNPLDYFYQDRGFCVAEAYYQSVLNPYQGLMVGEPLAAPFARRGATDWSGLTNGATLGGQVILNPSFVCAITNLLLAQVDLFVDGLFFQTVTNLPPAAGNVLTILLNGVAVNYEVPGNATIASVVSGLTAELNAQTNLTRVLAYATGDRIELDSLDPATPGSNITVSTSVSQGAASSPTTWITPARSNFLDTVAIGYRVVSIMNAPGDGDWLQLDVFKTNSTHVTVSVTNTPGNTSLAVLVQSLISLINATADLQSPDGLTAGDLQSDSSEAQCFLYARSSGWPAAAMQIQLTASTNLLTAPVGLRKLESNITDLRPRNHLYIGSGFTALSTSFAFQTALLPDGFHELSAVAYEGSSVRTQTRVTRNVRLQNTTLTAALTSSLVGTNATLDYPMQFTVTSSVTNISSVQLFSTGGVIGTVSNLQTAVFGVPSAMLGVGVHPFYALVTDTSGHQYRTQTQWMRLVPSIFLQVRPSPLTLSWSAASGVAYDILATTKLADAFQPAGSVTALGPTAQWPVSAPGISPAFYRVRLKPQQH